MKRERCKVLIDGTIIPGCMGTAAAMGCGKSDAAILSFCTCRAEDLIDERNPIDLIDELKAELQSIRDELQDIRVLLVDSES